MTATRPFAMRIAAACLMIAGLLPWGCTPRPDIVSTEKKEGEALSADDVRRVTVDQPFLISGDYFRDRDERYAYEFDLNKDDAPEGTKPAGSETTASAAASAPAAVFHQPQPEGLLTKIGFVVDETAVSAEWLPIARNVAPLAVSGLAASLADPDLVAETVSRTECMARRDLFCLAAAVGVYPGARMLLLVERIQAPPKWPGSLQVRISVVDTAIIHRYPSMDIQVPVDAVTDIPQTLASAFRQAAAFAVKKGEITPWVCRAFAMEKDEWYLSAGHQSGVRSGDTLAVTTGGKLVKSPAGQPAGWLPGGQKGMVQVTALFGQDLAVCRLVSGSGPASGDLLIRAQP